MKNRQGRKWRRKAFRCVGEEHGGEVNEGEDNEVENKDKVKEKGTESICFSVSLKTFIEMDVLILATN